jgi:LPS sulfotransferase NodH
MATTSDVPIFVVGFPRSGTTLLQSLLGAHPRIAAPPEMHFGTRIVWFADYWGDLGDDAVLRRVVEATLDSRRLVHAGFDVDRVFERARTGPRTYTGVLDAVMTDFAERHGKQRWSEKTPNQSASDIWQYFPQAQVVHIVRDPRPTVLSNLTKLGGWPDLLTTVHAWKSFTAHNIAAGASRGAAQYLRIRYEDLVADPFAVMRQVFGYLGEDFDAAYLENPDGRQASLPGETPLHKHVLGPIGPVGEVTGRGTLSGTRWWRLNAAVASSLEALGYPPPPRSVAVVGGMLNSVFYPAVWLRSLDASVRRFFVRTPEQRVAAEQRALRERVRRSRKVRHRWRTEPPPT